MLRNTYLGKIGRSIKEPRIELPRFSKVNVVYVWALVFLGMVLYTMVWFICGIFIMTFIDAITANFSFGQPWDSLVDLVTTIFLYHPVIALFGWIIYGILNSMRRDVEEWKVKY